MLVANTITNNIFVQEVTLNAKEIEFLLTYDDSLKNAITPLDLESASAMSAEKHKIVTDLLMHGFLREHRYYICRCGIVLSEKGKLFRESYTSATKKSAI